MLQCKKREAAPTVFFLLLSIKTLTSRELRDVTTLCKTEELGRNSFCLWATEYISLSGKETQDFFNVLRLDPKQNAYNHRQCHIILGLFHLQNCPQCNESGNLIPYVNFRQNKV